MKLTKVLDVMIAVLVIWIAYSFIERAVSSAERSPIVETEKRTPGLLQVGSLIDSALFGAQRRQDNTLIVYLSTSCPFCNASRDTYRSLSSLRPNLRLIVITSEPSADVKDWLKRSRHLCRRSEGAADLECPGSWVERDPDTNTNGRNWRC